MNIIYYVWQWQVKVNSKFTETGELQTICAYSLIVQEVKSDPLTLVRVIYDLVGLPSLPPPPPPPGGRPPGGKKMVFFYILFF